MYTHTDFIIPNIANAPITQERVTQICEIFGEASLRYQNLDMPEDVHNGKYIKKNDQSCEFDKYIGK